MGYNFFGKFPIMKALEAERLVIRAVKLNWGGERYYKETVRVGLSFRKQDVLYDYRRALSIEHAKTITGRANAAAWFDNVLEAIRKEKGLTQKEAVSIWEEMVRKQEELEEYDEEEEEWWKLYESMF